MVIRSSVGEGLVNSNYAFFSPRDESIFDAFLPVSVEIESKVYAIEEKMNAMEGSNTFGLDAAEMCLVPSIKIPSKFKVPNFEEYKGISCLRTRVRAYCRKMAAYSNNEKLLIHFFQDNLSEASLGWYTQLENTSIRTRKELAEAFLKHYQYNTDMCPNRTQLQSLMHKTDESFKEYAQRWRELATRVEPPFLEKDLVDMFLGTPYGPYLEKLIVSSSTGFSDLVVASERIKNCLKSGKYHNATGPSFYGERKPFFWVFQEKGGSNQLCISF